MIYIRGEAAFSAGAVVFDTEGKQVLTILDEENGRISFPKGGIEMGESIEDGACREVEEETGIVCKLWSPTPIAMEARSQRCDGKPKVVHWFGATFAANGQQKLEDYEQLVPKWFNIEDVVDKLAYDDDKQLFNACLSYFTANIKQN
ncbi:hypothetical protein LPJ79_000956 [Coemansia sp. RSA 1821]|nr:hypothetical protein LPJ79_000956 [Coemansia sp. RSA 1821]